jgi:hypothetical protein
MREHVTLCRALPTSRHHLPSSHPHPPPLRDASFGACAHCGGGQRCVERCCCAACLRGPPPHLPHAPPRPPPHLPHAPPRPPPPSPLPRRLRSLPRSTRRSVAAPAVSALGAAHCAVDEPANHLAHHGRESRVSSRTLRQRQCRVAAGVAATPSPPASPPPRAPHPPWWAPHPPWWAPRPRWWAPRPPWWAPRPPWWAPRPPWWAPRPRWWAPRPPLPLPQLHPPSGERSPFHPRWPPRWPPHPREPQGPPRWCQSPAVSSLVPSRQRGCRRAACQHPRAA